MALLKDDIATLRKSAISFLYIFIDPQAGGLSADIMHKRDKQIAELQAIASRNTGYSIRDLINFIRLGIAERYGKTPAQMLQQIYSAALPVVPTGVGSTIPPPDMDPGRSKAIDEAAERVKNLTTSVSENGKTTKTNVWKDVLSVLEWLVNLLTKIFGSSRDPRVYAPLPDDWSGTNAPRYIPNGDESLTQTAGFGAGGFLPVLAAGSILFYLTKNGGFQPAVKGRGKEKRKGKA